VDIDASYDVCVHITRARARQLYFAVEPLPAYRRRALCAIYAFARRVHDTAGGNLRSADKLRLLADVRAGIPRNATPRPTDPVLLALRDVNRRFPIPLTSLDDLIDGAESDLHGATYDTFEDLVQYCRLIAGSIVRLSVAVLGSRDPVAADQLADDLGVAMQLTSILRDRAEDLQRGRVYLPREDFELFGCPADPLSADPERLGRLIRHQARRNREWYDRGLALLPLLDARGAACIRALAGTHARLLERIERSAGGVPRGRPSLAAPEKARIRATELTSKNRSSRTRLIGSQQPSGSF
jgi:15-cis-phytoene synthase